MENRRSRKMVSEMIDGSYTTNNWQKIKDDDGVERWYLFDENGYIRTGFWKVNGYTYLLRTEAMCTIKEFDPSSQSKSNTITNWYGLLEILIQELWLQVIIMI